ncbi:PVC-type heme-binding CxxCH protein [Luteolibacter luteus]|uniref:C-type cytochrome n=1 Tax=Luteolibacter luteus TaxID=2728835 RepID=A0A858RM71_9BACT|nr:PVC-type heme-binding CxxCH protein [Luteolibacter luteus]QJE98486.1 c-type cytochrome [Luteolibacter luteus]
MVRIPRFPLLFLLFPGISLSGPAESYPCENGLVRSLVAREPMFMNPVAVAVDNDGSVYVTETTRRKVADLDIREVTWWIPDDLSHSSIEDKRAFFRKNITSERFRKHPSLKDHNGDGKIDWQDLTVHTEKIHKLADTDQDGVADSATLFAEGFNTEVTGIAAGVLARNGDVYATIAPDVWKLRDSDGDGKADEREAIASGFGVHINYAGHDMHGLIFGPDGKLYWTIGDKGTNVTSGGTRWLYPHEGALLRCNPDGSGFEVFARGLRNVQQIAFDDYGNIFGVDNDSDQSGEKERLLYIVEGSDTGWRCFYQYRAGKYNPWMAERIAFPDGPDRPASILPPLSLYLDGPSGFAHNPGTALNERYRGHFFLTQFPAGKINAFKLEPDGAAYKMTGDHLMASGTPFVGCNFGPDGALYVADWQGGYPLKEKGAVWKIDDPKEAGSEIRKEVAELLKEGTAKASVEDLLTRLGHADQRVRLDAQWELVTRKQWDGLRKIAASDNAAQLARIHALWGLSQGGQFDEVLFATLSSNKDAELRGQAAKWAGECGGKLPASFGPLLADDSARVRFLAAMAVGKAKDKAQLDGVLAMLEKNAGKDAYLQHAGAFALHCAAAGTWQRAASHPSPAVRLAAIVGLRNYFQDALRIQRGSTNQAPSPALRQMAESLLSDADPAVVAEAARALYGEPQVLPLSDALAELLEDQPGSRESALRRSITTNRRIGDEKSLLRIANFAANSSRPLPLRQVALEALASVNSDEPLDPVDGHHDPLKPLKIEPTLAAKIAGLLTPFAQDSQLSKAVAAALDALGVKEDPAQLAKQVLDPGRDPALRIAALRHLNNSKAAEWPQAAEAALKDKLPALRTEAATQLRAQSPEAVLAYIRETGMKSSDLAERQAAVRLLASLRNSKSTLDSLLTDLSAGKLDPAIQLEVIESASAQQLDSVHEVLATLASKEPLEKWSYVLQGGNAATGKRIFEENLAANCTACHRIGEEGSNVGPPLAKIGSKGREHLLKALVDPQGDIAPGYGNMTATKKDGSTVAGAFVEVKDGKLLLALPDGKKLEVPLADIASKTTPISAMPPMGEILKPAELRDLLEFLAGLK